MTRRGFVIAVPVVSAAAWAQQAGSGGKMRGTVMAAVQMELFSDYQCPSCKAFHEQTLKPLIADYVDKSKIYLIHREFPLPMHAYARQAAAIAVAADKIGRYTQVGDAMFAKQDSWSKDGRVQEAAFSVLSAAEQKKMQALVQSAEVKAEVDKDFELAKGKIQSTPTSVLTHKGKTYPVSGFVTYPIFRRFVDELLTK